VRSENPSAPFAGSSAPLDSFEVKAEDFAAYNGVLQIGLPTRRVDILNRADGITFDEAIAEGASFTLEGRRIPVIGRAALIAGPDTPRSPRRSRRSVLAWPCVGCIHWPLSISIPATTALQGHGSSRAAFRRLRTTTRPRPRSQHTLAGMTRAREHHLVKRG
jgi:hypothetical protein